MKSREGSVNRALHALIATTLMWALIAEPAQAERRALVIGNDTYQAIQKLLNARADADAMATALQHAGYAVTLEKDLDLRQMKDTVRTFRAQVRGGDEVVFFYSGHGVQIGGMNQLLPIDVRAQTEDQVRDDSLAPGDILAEFAKQKPALTLAVIDACRDNPFPRRGRAIGGRGLTGVAGATGQMVIYSAGEGQQALDRLTENDPVRNGVFTRVFVREMEKPGVPINDVVRNVREEVYRLAQNVRHEQVPAIYDQVLGSFFFYAPNSTIVVIAPATGSSAGSKLETGSGATAQTIVVGGKAFTEQQIMTAMTIALLRAKGFTPDRRAGMGSAAVRAAMESGQIDVYWEYTGTALGMYNKISDRFASTGDAYRRIKEVDAAKGIIWLNMSDVNNTYGFAMNRDDARRRGIATMSDFAKAINGGAKLTLASNAEFSSRADGLVGWQAAYGFELDRANVKRLDSGGKAYAALKDGQVDSAVVFATDGRIPAFNLVVLKDDKDYAAPYNLTPVVRKEVLDKNTKVAELLNALAAKLNDDNIARLNASVDLEKKSVEEVAEGFLKANGLI